MYLFNKIVINPMKYLPKLFQPNPIKAYIQNQYVKHLFKPEMNVSRIFDELVINLITDKSVNIKVFNPSGHIISIYFHPSYLQPKSNRDFQYFIKIIDNIIREETNEPME